MNAGKAYFAQLKFLFKHLGWFKYQINIIGTAFGIPACTDVSAGRPACYSEAPACAKPLRRRQGGQEFD